VLFDLMCSSTVFHSSSIDVFRSLNICKIFTIRRKREITAPWDIEASWIVENDKTMNRKWFEISDSPFEVLLNTECLPEIVGQINSALTANERVFVHWYFLEKPTNVIVRRASVDLLR
jgi:hypothetical protein